MKKPMISLLCLLMLLSACAPAQSGGEGLSLAPGQVSHVVKVVNTYDTSVLAVDWDDGEYTLDLCSVGMRKAVLTGEDGQDITPADLRPGMILEIVWDGMVAESWPCQISAEQVRVIEQGDDLVGLYREVLRELWDSDSALNHGAEILGFDFSTLTNLTGEEVTALEYLASCDLGLGLQYVTGTWEELCEAGYIDGENLYWENGVFFSLKVKEAPEEGRFIFDAEKWRSGLGAIYYYDCEASRGIEGQWSCEFGGFAIA